MTQLVSLWYFLTYSVLFDIPKHILSPYPGLLPVPSCPSEIFSLIWHIFYWLLQSSNLKPPLLTHGPIPDFMASRDTHTTMNAHFTSYVSHFHSFSHNYHNFIFPYGREKIIVCIQNTYFCLSLGEHTMWFNCIAFVNRALKIHIVHANISIVEYTLWSIPRRV